MKKTLLYVLFLALVIGHFAFVFLVVASFFVLPFKAPWYITAPLMAYIAYLITTRVDCPLTRLENYLRGLLGMKKIGAFVGHYMVRPIKIALGMKKRKNNNVSEL
jgi:Protein of Unknown function (DUF2784)